MKERTTNLVVSISRNTTQYDWLHGGRVTKPCFGNKESTNDMTPA